MFNTTKLLPLFIITIIFAIFPQLVIGSNEPTVKDYKTELESLMPDYLEVESYEIEAEESVGNKVEPAWITRFKATVKTKLPLYIVDTNRSEYIENDFLHNSNFFIHKPSSNQIAFLIEKTPAKKSIKFYGKTSATIYRSRFKFDFKFDGNPIVEIGEPTSHFDSAGYFYIISGSTLEKEYFDAVSNFGKQVAQRKEEEKIQIQKDKEAAQVIEKEKAKKYSEVLANSSNRLQGVWKKDLDSDKPRREVYIKFLPNNTVHVILSYIDNYIIWSWEPQANSINVGMLKQFSNLRELKRPSILYATVDFLDIQENSFTMKVVGGSQAGYLPSGTYTKVPNPSAFDQMFIHEKN